MTRAVRVVLGGLVLAVSVAAAIRYLDADFTIQRDVTYGPGGALVNPEPDFERRATLLRCNPDGAHVVNESGDMVFWTGDEPTPLYDADICDAPRRGRAVRAVAFSAVGIAFGAWLIVGSRSKEPIEPVEPDEVSTPIA